VRSGTLRRDSNVKRGRGRPKLTWEEAIKGDLKGSNIYPKIQPWIGVLGKQLFMCLNPDLWFLYGFNSSLPQLAWD